MKSRFLARIAIAAASWLVVCLGGVESATAAEKILRAGAYAMDITPQTFPISTNGGMQDRMSTGAHDPLHARCIVLDDGATELAIAVCDSCAIPREIHDAAKALVQQKTGVPIDHILISATHTHTAPTVTAVFQSDPDVSYQRYLTERIAAGIEQAHKQLEPAQISWGFGSDPTQLFCRRWLMEPGTIPSNPFGGIDQVKMNPGHKTKGLIKMAGPIDDQISLLSIRSKSGRPIALLANYSLHYVGGPPAGLLSADYFAAFAERMTQLIGATDAKPAFVGIMSNATSGDINNNNYGGEAWPRTEPMGRIKLVAESVAKNAFVAYQSIKYNDWIPLAAKTQELELKVRKPNADDVAYAQKILDGVSSKKVLTTLPEVYARETIKLQDYPATVKLKLQALRLGPLGIAAIPCEVFSEIGLNIKRKSALQPSFTIELANGYNGYLPTTEQHKLGGYETWRARSSYLEVEAADKIQAVILDLLAAVSKP